MKFQECCNMDCQRDIYGNICSNNGECVCGTCVCKPPWTGHACGCNKNSTNCRNCNKNSPDKICSGHGKCNCGECQCEDGYAGKCCELCVTCESYCEILRPAVEFLGMVSHKILITHFCHKYFEQKIVTKFFPKKFQIWSISVIKLLMLNPVVT